MKCKPWIGHFQPRKLQCFSSQFALHGLRALDWPLCEGNFRHKMTTIVGNCGQLWTSTLSPHLLSPHLDFPERCKSVREGLDSRCASFTQRIADTNLGEFGESSRGNTIRSNRTDSLWEGNLPLRGSLRGPLKTSRETLKTSKNTLKLLWKPLKTALLPWKRLRRPLLRRKRLTPHRK